MKKVTRLMPPEDDTALAGFETWHDRVVCTGERSGKPSAIDEGDDDADGRSHS
jgi:hypothetical protein